MQRLDQLISRLSPIGIVEPPRNDAAQPRHYPRRLRLATLLVLAVFAVVVVASTALSLGAYCLTTDAGTPEQFRLNHPR